LAKDAFGGQEPLCFSAAATSGYQYDLDADLTQTLPAMAPKWVGTDCLAR